MLVNIMGLIDVVSGLVLLQGGPFSSAIACLLLIKGGISLISQEM